MINLEFYIQQQSQKKTFLDKQKLKEFVASRPTLQVM